MKKIFKQSIVSIITWQAKLVLKKYKPKIVGITGSVGKTSTKDAIYTALASSFFVRKSQKSFNSEIGVPLTILGLPNGWLNPFIWIKNILKGFLLILFPHAYPAWLVLEIGADKPHDIENVTKWLKPDISIITQFGDVPVHIEFFPSIEDLINEKGNLARALKPDGFLILNHDDKRVMSFGENDMHKRVTYGFEPGADIQASHESIIYGHYENSELEFPEGMAFKINHAGSSLPGKVIGALGKQHIYPILAAYAVGVSQNINQVTLSQALEKHIPPRGRMRLIAGEKDTLIIDDTYNSSPVAVHAALNTLHELQLTGRRIAVLGDMLELGQYSADEHKKVGEHVARSSDILVTVGVRSRGTAEAALENGMNEGTVFQFETSREAGKFIESVIITTGDIILVKGSQSMRMERIIEEIMAYPEQKEKLLVRQSKQWLKKN